MVSLTAHFLPNNNDLVLNLDDLLDDLEFALLAQESFALNLPFGQVTLEPIKHGRQFLLALKSLKSNSVQPKDEFFQKILMTLNTLVEALSDHLALDKDIDLIVSETDARSFRSSLGSYS